MNNGKQPGREGALALRLGRRLSLLTSPWLVAALLLATPAGADPASPTAAHVKQPPADEENSAPPAHPTGAPGTSQAAPRSAKRTVPSHRHRRPGVPTRRSVRAQIESIEPITWLSRYGIVERRELPPIGEPATGLEVPLSRNPAEAAQAANLR